MATKSFLNAEQLEQAQTQLRPVGMTNEMSSQFSLWLEDKLQQRLLSDPDWLKAHPVLTGSWARHEMAPKSDLDVVFTGDMGAVQRLVEKLNKEGLKLRYRVPESLDDWTVGVEPFDVMALLEGRGVTVEASQKLSEQRALILKKGAKFKRALLQAMRSERRARAKRYDSMATFLEPNLKYGAGGARDAQQALMTARLFAEKLVDWQEPLLELVQYKQFILNLRQKLHLLGFGDQLVASEQAELASWCGFLSRLEFMRHVQIVLERVSFLSDAISERVALTQKAVTETYQLHLENLAEITSALLHNPCALVQYRISEKLRLQPLSEVITGKGLEKLISVKTPDATLVGAYRSGLLHALFPNIQRLRGWVQHDQYHRYTADAHLVQTVREVVRVAEKPQRVGCLRKIALSLSLADWRLLIWGALYHDMGKGLGGEHALKGQGLAARELREFGFSESFVQEVCWLVENHLLLSESAFRKNPRSPSTWRELHARNVQGPRLKRLAVFTAIDILATNPDAWNKWKESLLLQLVETLESSQTESYFNLLSTIRTQHETMSQSFLDGLDPFVVEHIPAKLLIEDYKLLTSQRGDLSPQAWRSRSGHVWIRLHSRQDRAGLFADFVERLYAIGVSVISASVQTYEEFGAYDWFRVKTTKSPTALKKLLAHDVKAIVASRDVRFDSIRIMGQDDQEWVLSFRGRDQKGALRAAASALFEEGLEIQWARVHTWGREIDDVFGVKPIQQDLKTTVARLSRKWAL